MTSIRKGVGGVLLANYRAQAIDSNQDQERGIEMSSKDREIPKSAETYSISEAARATASYKPFFGACNLNPGNHQHFGGAEKFACPAEVVLSEAKSLWPHMRSNQPDLLLSVGCHEAAAAASDNTKDCASTDAIWSGTFGEKSQQEPGKYIRLNPVVSMQDRLRGLDYAVLLKRQLPFELDLANVDLCGKVSRVAQRLVTTTFYFERTSRKPREQGDWVISGTLSLRALPN